MDIIILKHWRIIVYLISSSDFDRTEFGWFYLSLACSFLYGLLLLAASSTDLVALPLSSGLASQACVHILAYDSE